jgi:hypothetical protein
VKFWALRFSRLWLWKWLPSGMWRRVVIRINVIHYPLIFLTGRWTQQASLKCRQTSPRIQGTRIILQGIVIFKRSIAWRQANITPINFISDFNFDIFKYGYGMDFIQLYLTSLTLTTYRLDLSKLSIYLYSCCSHLEHRASVKRFVLLQFLHQDAT